MLAERQHRSRCKYLFVSSTFKEVWNLGIEATWSGDSLEIVRRNSLTKMINQFWQSCYRNYPKRWNLGQIMENYATSPSLFMCNHDICEALDTDNLNAFYI